MPKGVGVQIPPPARRALSSSGRAPALHAGGGRFESDRVHMRETVYIDVTYPAASFSWIDDIYFIFLFLAAMMWGLAFSEFILLKIYRRRNNKKFRRI